MSESSIFSRVSHDNDEMNQQIAVPQDAKPDTPKTFSGQSFDPDAFSRFAQSILEAETLVILAGLGTSLGLMNSENDGALVPANAPKMSDLFALVQALTNFERYEQLAPEAVASQDVESLLSAFQAQLTLKADPDLEELVENAEKLIASSCRFVVDETDLGHHEQFLRKIVRRQDRLSRPRLFTTNYDLAFEVAADRAHIHVIDGFGVGRRGAFDGGNFDMDIVRRMDQQRPVLEPAVMHLHKVHGSVDWDMTNGKVTANPEPENPVLIYPASNKYQLSFRPPYLEGMARWQMALRNQNVGLLVVGFGCNDAHLVGPLEAALRGNPGLKALFVTPGIDSGDNDTFKRVRRLIELGDKRVGTLAATFNQLVQALPDSASIDAHERHAALVDEAWESA